MSNQLPPLVINNWQEGIADSPFAGRFAAMQAVDVFSEPGILKAGFAAAKESSTTVTGFIRWMDINPASGVIYGRDEGAKVYRRSSAGVWSNPTGGSVLAGKGLRFWKGYFISFSITGADAILDDPTTPTYTNLFVTTITTDADEHPAIHGQDDILYIGGGRILSSLAEVTTFNPANGATFTFTANALDLPAAYRIKTLGELGDKLMIGAGKGANVYDTNVADIFPWNRVDSSFSLPIRLFESGVNQMVVYNNRLYVNAGTKNNIYISDGTSISLFKRIPHTVWPLTPTVWMNPSPGAMAVSGGKLLFASKTGGGTIAPMGVWAIDNGRLVMETQLSCGAGAAVQIGCIFPIGLDRYLVSWFDGTSTYGVDVVGISGYRVNDATYATSFVDTQMFRVGSKTAPRTFWKYTLQLERPLATGQGVQISYRTSFADSFTTMDTCDTVDQQSFNGDAGIANAENLQLRIALTAAANSTATPRVIDLTLE